MLLDDMATRVRTKKLDPGVAEGVEDVAPLAPRPQDDLFELLFPVVRRRAYLLPCHFAPVLIRAARINQIASVQQMAEVHEPKPIPGSFRLGDRTGATWPLASRVRLR